MAFINKINLISYLIECVIINVFKCNSIKKYSLIRVSEEGSYKSLIKHKWSRKTTLVHHPLTNNHNNYFMGTREASLGYRANNLK